MKYLFFYSERCTGCKECSIVCAIKRYGEANPKRGAIQIVKDEFERYEVPFVCLQCDEPECGRICPRKALTKIENIVHLDQDKCIRCRLCVIVCPYGGVSSYRGEIIKCDLCDGDPLCVKFCSTQAIVYAEETTELITRRRKLVEKLLGLEKRGVSL